MSNGKVDNTANNFSTLSRTVKNNYMTSFKFNIKLKWRSNSFGINKLSVLNNIVLWLE